MEELHDNESSDNDFQDEMFQNISLVIYDHFEQHCEMVSFDIKYMVLGRDTIREMRNFSKK